MDTSPFPMKVCTFWTMSAFMAFMAIVQWAFFSMLHLLWHRSSIYIVIFENSWQSHLWPSVWHWICHYLFLRLRSVAVRIRTPNHPLASRTRLPTAAAHTHLDWYTNSTNFIQQRAIQYHWQFAIEFSKSSASIYLPGMNSIRQKTEHIFRWKNLPSILH